MHLPTKSVTKSVHIGIGESTIGKGDSVLHTNLGSCLGIVIGWPSEGLYALAHVLLPRRTSAPDTRLARFGNTAVPFLLRRLRVPAEKRRELSAVVCGGAAMFERNNKVGQQNQDIVVAALRTERIRVVGRDTGRAAGRHLTVNCLTGQVTSMYLDDERNEQTWQLYARKAKK